MAASDTITPPHNVVVLKSVEYPAFNREVKLLDRGESIDRDGRVGIHEVRGRSAPIAVHDRAGSRQFAHHIMTQGPDHEEEARVLDLAFAIGGTYLWHVPHGSRAAGGYVAVLGVSRRSLYRGSDEAPYVYEVECRVVAPPDADVQTALVTWHTLESVYGSWEAVWAAHSSWLDLWQTVADPGELLPS